MEFSDKKSETDLKSERVKAVSISVAKENQGEIAEKMSLYEATCVPTLKLRALLDIFLTIQTMSTRQFWVFFFFSYVWNVFAKPRSKLSGQLMLHGF